VPAGPEIGRLLVRLAAQLQHVGVAGHGSDERIDPERTHLQGEGLELVQAERLVGEAHHRVAGPGRLHLGQNLGGKGPGKVDALDPRAEAACGRLHPDHAVVVADAVQHGVCSLGHPALNKGLEAMKHPFASGA